ncbi:hypothetical protein BT69DRAFT_1287732, partial [Atractiella rhizophila]
MGYASKLSLGSKNKFHMLRRINTLLKQPNWQTGTTPLLPDSEYERNSFNLFLSTAAKSGRWREYDGYLLRMREAGVEEDEWTWSAKIRRAVEEDGVGEMEDEFARSLIWDLNKKSAREDGKKGHGIGTEVWNLVIWHHLSGRQIDRARQLYSLMNSQSAVPMSAIFPSLPSDIQDGEKLLVQPPAPDHITRTILLRSISFYGLYPFMLSIIRDISSSSSSDTSRAWNWSLLRSGALDMQNYSDIFHGFALHVHDRSSFLQRRSPLLSSASVDEEKKDEKIRGKGALDAVMDIVERSLSEKPPERESSDWTLEHLRSFFEAFMLLRAAPSNSNLPDFFPSTSLSPSTAQPLNS